MLGDIHSLCRSVFHASVREQRGLSRLFLEKHTSSTSLRGREYSCDARPGCDTYGSSSNPNACAANDADGCSDGCAYRFTDAITYRSGKHTLTWK